MYIKRIKLHNFKRFRDWDMNLNNGMNILVGDNEVGKTTIMEAIHLCLTGMYRGRYLKNDLIPHIFNSDAVSDYFAARKNGRVAEPPYMQIELWFDQGAEFVGNTNSEHDAKAAGISYTIHLNEDFRQDFDQFIASDKLSVLPVEYYSVLWESFSRTPLTTRKLPIHSSLVDGTSQANVSNQYISHIVKNLLSNEDCVNLSHAIRESIQGIETNEQLVEINKRISESASLGEEDRFSLSADQGTNRVWENALVASIDKIPLSHKGRGCQVRVQTKLSLARSSNVTKDSSIILIEEPESHLSFTSMNQLISFISNHTLGKQIIISTHSSFVINKLGLNSLILISKEDKTALSSLSQDTQLYFQKLAGYETLRMLLSKRTILVEGDSDELIVQKGYLQEFGKLPIEDGIDVQCIKGLSFLRYLELAKCLRLRVHVVTDNDGNIEKLNKKYAEYLSDDNSKQVICFSDSILNEDNFSGTGLKPEFNYNTLEPNILHANGLEVLNSILGTNYDTDKDLLKHMHAKKSECALLILNETTSIIIPTYILKAIRNE